MKPHVLIVVENLPVPRDYRVWLIATSLRRAGYAVTVISPADDRQPPGVFHQEGVLILRHSLKEAKSWLGYPLEYATALLKERALARRLHRTRPFQILHACNPPDLIWLVAAPFQRKGAAYIFDHHDLCPELILAKRNVTARSGLSWPFKLLHDLMLKLERTAQTRADFVLSTNATYRALALDRNALPEDRTFVVRTGLRRQDLPAPAKAEPVADETIRLLYVGVMARQDGVDILLDAAGLIRRKYARPLDLVLMGDGPEFAALKRQAASLGLQDACHFTGFLPRREVYGNLLRGAAQGAIGITPDPYTPMNDASTMLKTLDYLAAGLPQVLFDLKEHRNTCQDAALYVPQSTPEALAEAIVKLHDDPAMARKMRQAALSRAPELLWENDGLPALLKAYEAASALVAKR